jgi:hypothetical protein
MRCSSYKRNTNAIKECCSTAHYMQQVNAPNTTPKHNPRKQKTLTLVFEQPVQVPLFDCAAIHGATWAAERTYLVAESTELVSWSDKANNLYLWSSQFGSSSRWRPSSAFHHFFQEMARLAMLNNIRTDSPIHFHIILPNDTHSTMNNV